MKTFGQLLTCFWQPLLLTNYPSCLQKFLLRRRIKCTKSKVHLIKDSLTEIVFVDITCTCLLVIAFNVLVLLRVSDQHGHLLRCSLCKSTIFVSQKLSDRFPIAMRKSQGNSITIHKYSNKANPNIQVRIDVMALKINKLTSV